MLKANPSDWQQDFIATNLLAIGYNAWNGYLKIGRGVIVCSTNSPRENLYKVGQASFS